MLWNIKNQLQRENVIMFRRKGYKYISLAQLSRLVELCVEFPLRQRQVTELTESLFLPNIV